MLTWKDFLEQDKEYDSIDLHITMAEDLKLESFLSKVDIVDNAFDEESALLSGLFEERNGKPSQANAEATSPRKDGNLSPRGKGHKK